MVQRFRPVFAFLFLYAISSSQTCGQATREFRDRPDIPKEWPREPVRGAHGMVASDEPLASAAGVEILKRGGNAVDAAVATAFALAVVEPAAGNIGGGGFMLVRLANGKTKFFDYREMAPGKATRDMYIRPDGKLDEEGFPVSEKLAREFAEQRSDLQKFSMSSHIFLNDGKMYKVGDRFRQPELAATLKRIAKKGPEEFYRGETAKMLAEDMATQGGLITLDDLAHYQPKIRDVLHGNYTFGGERWEVLAPPPPSSGGVA